MSFNNMLMFIAPLGIAIASAVLWRKKRGWATACMAAMQLILVVNIALVLRLMPQLSSLSEELFGSPLVLQAGWYYVSRGAEVAFAIAFMVFSVGYVKRGKAP